MSRSRLLAAPAFALLLALPACPAVAQPANTQIDAIGTLDYRHGRDKIKVGSWVKYHITSKNERGVTDDYTVTVLIPGEEHWWGEDCFWVETWTQAPNGPLHTAATLMSYAIFDDSLAGSHTQLYQRKTIAGSEADGSPVEQLFRRGNQAVKSRVPISQGLHQKVDSLGAESVKTPKGDFVCSKVRIEQGVGTTSESADSSEYTETREVHVLSWTPEVPLTSTAREDIDVSQYRRAWLIGRSQESGPQRLISRTTGTVELLDYGTGGLDAKMLPASRCHSLAEQRAVETKAAGTKAAAVGTRKTGATAKPGLAKRPRPSAH
jgi:hypothetical protein